MPEEQGGHVPPQAHKGQEGEFNLPWLAEKVGQVLGNPVEIMLAKRLRFTGCEQCNISWNRYDVYDEGRHLGTIDACPKCGAMGQFKENAWVN